MIAINPFLLLLFFWIVIVLAYGFGRITQHTEDDKIITPLAEVAMELEVSSERADREIAMLRMREEARPV